MTSEKAPYPDQPPPYSGAGEGGAQPGFAPPPGQPGYPPQGQPGYPPQGQPGYPPQGQPGYAPPSVQPVVTPPTTIVVTSMQMGTRSTPVQCPHCQQHVNTVCEYETGMFAWLIVGVLCLVGCWLGCCLIPLCIDDCKDVRHTCPNCRNNIGMFKRL
ncbi:PREDICTED: lipopolysaccharide-induced tumor necrosis factor-alpha factor homolog [Priapulus caudatus]|uniref:Lipopolysaccharide-induced tumor necrosis factor-alpha factor homolog n=1 Tax=Priapulus caudatus TaxID=37621 RepID=A0ABM1DQR7_PRICU|nr:PREDICTED: lipopolysaccharide-induced tumor necrosis factor-alpha factor homolog [Priapulus caudatus]XP_014662290.1 PREDICTED: lipopolysaccharide-induced tumor necrosis factor-alpha factor homolog [Priapulus caudatus]XP_014662291.1 PREDICTED: lipopolysaccharide-induced tumor necrosis factor-alpha factor homolog [Priapulus caudatus]